MEPVVIAALYQFVAFPDYQEWREPLRERCDEWGIKGTLLLAAEGINGTIAGSRQAIDQLLGYFKRDPRFASLEHKESVDDKQPFYRMKVKLKKEIVTMGVEGIDPRHVVGTYVKPTDWNQLISDPDVVVVDTRNQYEYELGTFKGAIDPETDSFSEFPQYVKDHLDPQQHKKVAMFCTGGIRCEKSTAYMKEQGFEEVYHLQGGILKYLEEVPAAESLWQGECYVFDNRVAVDHNLEKGHYDLCHGCRLPITAEDKQSPHYEEGITCPRCYDKLTASQRERFAERQRQIKLAKARDQEHIGSDSQKR